MPIGEPNAPGRHCGRRPTVASALLVIGLALLIGACTSPPPPPLPDVGQLAPGSTLPAASSQAAEPPAAADLPATPERRPLHITVHRFLLPLHDQYPIAWGYVTDTGLDPLVRAAWERCGLRVASLPEELAQDFVTALGPPIAYGQERVVAGLRPLPGLRKDHLVSRMTQLYGGRRIEGRFMQPWTDAYGSPHVLEIRGGQMRLWLDQEPRSGSVALVPHYYNPESSLRPRLPLVKALDGTILRDLALVCGAEARTFVVTIVPIPTAEPAGVDAATAATAVGDGDEDAAQEAPAAQTDTASPPAEAESGGDAAGALPGVPEAMNGATRPGAATPAAPAQPVPALERPVPHRSLGTLLLTSQMPKLGWVQAVLLIHIQPDSGATSP